MKKMILAVRKCFLLKIIFITLSFTGCTTVVQEKSQDVIYTVKHMKESIPLYDEYGIEISTPDYETDVIIEKKSGKKGTETKASAKKFEGFEAQEFQNVVLSGDSEETVIEIYYKRNTYKFVFKSDNKVIKEVSGKYGAAFNTLEIPAPVKDGWTFGGWNTYGGEVDSVYAAEDKVFNAYWISTVQTGQPVFDLDDISLSVASVESKYICTVKVPEVFANENWTYKWYVNEVLQQEEKSESLELSEIKYGKGVKSVTVKAVRAGETVPYVKTVSVTIE